jgi:hypothetical protein
MAGERRRRPAAEVRVVPPAHLAGRGIERVEPAVEHLLEDAPVADDRGKLEQVPTVERPESAERRPDAGRGDRAQAGVVGAVRRPRCRRALRGRRGDRGRNGSGARRRDRRGLRPRPGVPARGESAGRGDQREGRDAPRYRSTLR